MRRWAAAAGVLTLGLAAAGPAGGAADDEPRPGASEAWEETSPGFVVPDDPLLREQWWLYNFGQEIGGRVEGTVDADIRAPEAWAITTGSPDVVVAVLDFGIDYDHPDLEGQVWTNAGEAGDGRESNGVDDDGNGYVDDHRGWDFVHADNDPLDEGGHGTGVSGVIAARGGDGFGITGIAPGVRILPLRVGDTGVDLSVTPAAIEYAAGMGAQIVVMSYTTEPSGLFTDPDAETAAMLAHPEILFVTGAGNDGIDYRDFAGRTGLTPCNNPTVPNLICVAGTDRFDEAWEESTFGGGRVHIAAPAESMLLVNRPREVVARGDFGDERAWPPVDDMPGFWAPQGPPPEFAFQDDDAAGDGRVLRITQAPTEGTDAVAVLRLDETVDLTGRMGCDLTVRASGAMTGSAALSVGLFRVSDERRNAFGGELLVTRTELEGAERTFVPLSVPVRAFEPLEVALRTEIRRFGENAIDVRLDDWEIACWNPEHGDRDYAYWAGTSFATPLVAGVAALVASAEPDLDPLQIRQAILESAVSLPSLDGLVETGGRLDAFGALRRAEEIAAGDAGLSAPTDEGAASARTPGPSARGAASSVSFGSHDDYEVPAPGETVGVPAGRGMPDPAAAPAADEPGADPPENAPGATTEGDDGGGGFPPWAWAAILAAAAAMGAGALAWVRSRASAAQREELDATVAARETEEQREADAVRAAEESRRRTEQLARERELATVAYLEKADRWARYEWYQAHPEDFEKHGKTYSPYLPEELGSAGGEDSGRDAVQWMRDGFGTTAREEEVAKALDGKPVDDQRLQDVAGLQSDTSAASSTFVDHIRTGTTDAGVVADEAMRHLFEWLSNWGK